MNIIIRPATKDDALDVQILRKTGWQDNYVNEESGITKELLVNKLAKLPPESSDLEYFTKNISKPENKDKNIVATENNKAIGVIFYETLENGNGDIGLFVDREYRGQGIGSRLLKALIEQTTNTIEVTIFSKNKSRNLYKNLVLKKREKNKNIILMKTHIYQLKD